MNGEKNFFWRRISFLFTFSALCMLIVGVTYFAGEHIASAGAGTDKDASATPEKAVTVIIDAGHGGLDGGASTEGGVLEKHLNLAVAKKVQALLACANVNVVMTRESDIMLADEGSAHKKRDDLNARLHMADAYENCVFVSIHMNKFPVAKYSGLQVYYSGNHAGGALLAGMIQENTARFLQKSNTRTPKAADDSIYILHHIKVPAVLVECGFLSNPEEAAMLGTESYQNKLAAVICASVLEYLEGEG